jgi:hypothetical protein
MQLVLIWSDLQQQQLAPPLPLRVIIQARHQQGAPREEAGQVQPWLYREGEKFQRQGSVVAIVLS